jgi:hypothetical protein
MELEFHDQHQYQSTDLRSAIKPTVPQVNKLIYALMNYKLYTEKIEV